MSSALSDHKSEDDPRLNVARELDKGEVCSTTPVGIKLFASVAVTLQVPVPFCTFPCKEMDSPVTVASAGRFRLVYSCVINSLPLSPMLCRFTVAKLTTPVAVMFEVFIQGLLGIGKVVINVGRAVKVVAWLEDVDAKLSAAVMPDGFVQGFVLGSTTSVATVPTEGPTNSPANEYADCKPARVNTLPIMKSTSQHRGLAPSGRSCGLQFVIKPPMVD